MAKGPKYAVKFRRRREGKTDYKKRLAALKSGKNRFVVRISNKNVTCQITSFSRDGDKTGFSASSNELKKQYGWQAAGNNAPSAYLVGYLCGKKAAKGKVKEAILDCGVSVPIAKTNVFAAVKGAIDSGLQIPVDEKMLPDEARITGQHIADYSKNISKEEKKEKFSTYSKNKLAPEKLPEHVEKTKKLIESKLKNG